MCERCEKKFLKKKISPGGVNEAGLMERMEIDAAAAKLVGCPACWSGGLAN
jgi:hypothetical protein